jgi:hypothetical protein
MTVDVVTEVTIAKPREVVSAFSATPDNAPKWYANIKSAEWRTEPPLRIGTKVAFVAQFLRRRLVYTYEVVEYVPGDRFVCEYPKDRFRWKRHIRGTRQPRAAPE